MAYQNPFGTLFAKSPMGPLQEHMAKAHASAEALRPFLEAAQQGDWKTAKLLHKEIVSLEADADKKKRTLRRHLPKSLFMPVSRSDLLELLTAQDNIANASKDVAGLMLGRKMAFPEQLDLPVLAFADACIATSAQALLSVQGIDALLDAGFGHRQVKAVEAKIHEIEKLEHKTDKMQVKLRGSMFKLESELPPVEVMFLYQILDRMGGIADHAEQVGKRLQILIIV